uniref:Uncharacterized protein n=1 Tax=Zea mays TaxID=4577 RepID=A0A804LD44_MAIZE
MFPATGQLEPASIWLAQASHGPRLLPEQILLRLAGRSLGEVAEHHRPGRHVVRQPSPAEADDVVRGGSRAVPERDERARRLAPVVVGPRDHRGVEHRGVPEQHRLHLDGADVLAARDDDVLGPVLELDVPVRVAHAEVARAQPPAAHGLLRGPRVLVVPAHDRVPPEHHLAHGAPVGGQRLHARRVLDGDLLDHGVSDALQRLHPGALRGRQRVPLGLPHARRRRAVRLGEPVPVRDVEAELVHLGQHLRRRRRAARGDADPPRQRLPIRRRRVREHAEHRGRAAHVGDAVAHDVVEDHPGGHAADADARAALRRGGPHHAPPVAVEHRHGPEVHGHGRHLVDEHRGQRVEERAAVAVDDALGPRRGARRVVQRYRVALVCRPPDFEVARRAPQKRFVLRDRDAAVVAAAAVAGAAAAAGVRDRDDERKPVFGVGEEPERVAGHGVELRLHEEDLGFRVFQQDGHHGRVVAGVERAQDGAGHRHAEMELVHRRYVRGDDRDLIRRAAHTEK